MTIINFDDSIGKKFNTTTNNIFCLSHPKNIIIGNNNNRKKIIGKKILEKQTY